ncbi:helix-turn-helix domain-containing protein [Arthrobacter echini]|uniref:Helix-turn-helix domain-containing protein n=1 Tax=Arthrobacter echini TaxID=1529066 RepID=A0A4S5DZY4_9MICC|nr:helix-turn-helix domain-containing protein [Arthrobacter echini]
MDQDTMLTAPQLSEWLGTTSGNLAQMRYLGTGPKFVKLGRAVRYRQSDVEAWLGAQTRQQTGEQVSA